LPPTGRETGSDVGLKVFLSTGEGDAVEHPRHHRTAETRLKGAAAEEGPAPRLPSHERQQAPS
jgi:hypothetical protein